MWNGIDPTGANHYSDYNIKQEYSDAQLLGYYRKGLELQNRLIELYRERQEDVGVSSVSIFPALYPGEAPEYEDEIYKGYCTWGRDNAGISIAYQQDN